MTSARDALRKAELRVRAEKLERAFDEQLRAKGIGAYVREHRFHGTRRWRFDFAWPTLLVAVEIDGGVWTGGRHTTGKGFEADCQKMNAATQLGWRVLRGTGRMVKSRELIDATEALLRQALRQQETER